MICLYLAGAAGMRAEVRLLRDLVNEYDPAARPVKNLTDVVKVHMGFSLFQIRELVTICLLWTSRLTDSLIRNLLYVKFLLEL